ncbi:DUF2184 domain-containing protein [Enterococcus wangshanyuanii]|uniref:Major capsid protein n=1 Tax=Enterococcus wangshanyuanii TaxID=2005703 RepID=A0ABQ1PJW2_9ENTE|nr:family 1 encapsulin nanocompartment shell protein [Enterococcus wangshanyuanii]GGC98086.1 hypothetical protein GCM10011573_29520 [Enterococcus wangshanyuanii]
MSNVTTTLEARDLEHIDKTIYQAPQEELVARSIFNIKSDVHPGAETYGYYVMTRSGVAKIIANGSDDIPLVDTDLTRHHQPIYSIADAVSYTVSEIRQAQMTGNSVDTTKVDVARRAISEKENNMIFVGDESVKLKGVVNADGIQVMNASKKFKDATSEEIVEMIREARAKITTIPGYRTAKLKLMVSPQQYELLNRRYSEFDPRTILQVIEGHKWFSSIDPVADLENQGTAKSDCLLIMDVTPLTCEILIPMDITRHQEEYASMKWKVPFEERCGGALIRTPYAIIRVDGI